MRLFDSDYLRLLKYNLEVEQYKNKGVFLGCNTIVYDTVFSSSTKGDFFYIGNNCTISGAVLLGHDASPSLFLNELQTDKHPILSGSRHSYRKPIYIGDNVFVGYGSILLPGVVIGSNVIIGAGTVVSKDIPSDSIVYGNPCIIKKGVDSFIHKHKDNFKKYPHLY